MSKGVGKKHTSPQFEAGDQIDPPISLPIPNLTELETTSPASPPVDPPQDLSLSRGLRASPQSSLLE
jgi:hypothetical protein